MYQHNETEQHLVDKRAERFRYQPCLLNRCGFGDYSVSHQ